MTAAVASPNLKRTGAYYTDAVAADFLTRWAVRDASDRVLDPSFGGGVFLDAAIARVQALGGDVAEAVHGVELDPDTHRAAVARLSPTLPADNLTQCDFFAVEPNEPRRFEAVVGNPPFVRFQTFAGAARTRAMRRVEAQGVRLPLLASSWAAFVVHSVAMLDDSGRLAMVLPMEMWHASYGAPIVRFLRERFASLGVITFRRRLFPDIAQDTVLLLADGLGGGPASIRWRDLDGPEALADVDPEAAYLPRSRKLDAGDADALADGSRRLVEQFVPKPARDLYRELVASGAGGAGGGVRRLGDLARVGIGYVSGNNDFFHLSAAEAERRRIPSDYLTPAVRKGRALAGLRFTADDWRASDVTGDAAFLLQVPPPLLNGSVPPTLRAYLNEGEAEGVPNAYKCRVRSPWYSVPHVYMPDAFLTYMSGRVPRFVVNDAGATAPNNLHVVRLRPEANTTADALAAAWPSALTRLSVELEGHAMGGGMLKLEPGEAERVALPPLAGPMRLDLDTLDALARAGRADELAELVDAALLRDGLGLDTADCRRLRDAAVKLAERRYSGGKGNEPMSLLDAVKAAGTYPPDTAPAHEKKRFAELLSNALAPELAEALRNLGMPGVKPIRGGPGEKAFQGGLGPKRVDVTYSDERHGPVAGRHREKHHRAAVQQEPQEPLWRPLHRGDHASHAVPIQRHRVPVRLPGSGRRRRDAGAAGEYVPAGAQAHGHARRARGIHRPRREVRERHDDAVPARHRPHHRRPGTVGEAVRRRYGRGSGRGRLLRATVAPVQRPQPACGDRPRNTRRRSRGRQRGGVTMQTNNITKDELRVLAWLHEHAEGFGPDFKLSGRRMAESLGVDWVEAKKMVSYLGEFGLLGYRFKSQPIRRDTREPFGPPRAFDGVWLTGLGENYMRELEQRAPVANVAERVTAGVAGAVYDAARDVVVKVLAEVATAQVRQHGVL